MKLYGVTAHAIEQAVERLGRKKEHAQHEINQLMQTAVHQGTTGHGRIYDHLSSRTRLILDLKKDKVITVYSMDTEKPAKWYDDEPTVAIDAKPKPSAYNAIIEKARSVIAKEIEKARRQFTTESRKLTLHEAEIGLEIAKLSLNKARARAPHIQAILQAQISDLESGRQAVFAELVEVKARFEQMRRDAEGYL